MHILTPPRPSLFRSLKAKLFSGKATRSTEPTVIEEHEVYLAGLWDQSTSHAPVEFTGTLEDCEAFLAANPRRNCLSWKQAIRPTGNSMEVQAR